MLTTFSIDLYTGDQDDGDEGGDGDKISPTTLLLSNKIIYVFDYFFLKPVHYYFLAIFAKW